MRDIIERFQGDSSEKVVRGELPGVEVDAGQLGIVIQHSLKVGCTIRYAWVPGHGTSDAVSADLATPNGNVWRGLTCRARSATMLYEGVEQLLPEGGGEK
jgi:hypothetical protein